MSMRHAILAEITSRDPRYAYEAYEFIFAALHHTQRMLGKPLAKEWSEDTPQHHVTGRQLAEGVRDLALRQFGLMARVVLRQWGIHSTADIGEIVFNLIDANLMSKTDADTRDDFRDVFDMDEALTRGFEIKLEESE